MIFKELPSPLSEEFLKEHAFEMGIEVVRTKRLIAEFHQECIKDDYVPGILFHPGAGYQAAMTTGTDLVFATGGASYLHSPVIMNYERMDAAFNHDNRWIDYALNFWKGVQTQDIYGLAVSPRYNRSPLDLANDLRGNQLFYDLFNFPEQVDELVDGCAESLIEIDRIIRSEISIFHNAVGGAQGIALPFLRGI